MLTILGNLTLLAGAVQHDPTCSLIRPVAPDEPAARRIAEAVIANVPPSQRVRQVAAAGTRYRLVVLGDEDRPGSWVVFQTPPGPARPRRPDVIVLNSPGHGVGFRIDRCTGAISEMAYQR